jgi:hypothetical protein
MICHRVSAASLESIGVWAFPAEGSVTGSAGRRYCAVHSVLGNVLDADSGAIAEMVDELQRIGSFGS